VTIEYLNFLATISTRTGTTIRMYGTNTPKNWDIFDKPLLADSPEIVGIVEDPAGRLMNIRTSAVDIESIL
jgi:hypothetical protein